MVKNERLAVVFHARLKIIVQLAKAFIFILRRLCLKLFIQMYSNFINWYTNKNLANNCVFKIYFANIFNS